MSNDATAGTAAGDTGNQEAIEELESLGGSVSDNGDFEPAPELADDAPAPAPNIPTTELLKPVIGLVCASIAPAWGVSPEEQETLCDAYAGVIDKYFPDGVPMGPEVAALLVTASVVMPRLGKPLKIEQGVSEGDGDQSQHDVIE